MSSNFLEDKFLTDNLNGKRVVVAFSGGADSVSLLHRLFKLKDELDISLEAAHLNHCLRGEESERDEAFVKDFCKKHNILLHLKRVDIKALAKAKSLSEETCGREERYLFFDEVAKDALVATAHTLSDNMETVIFHMIRGTALKGLCGIPQKRGNIVRPLIECTREDVEDYCRREKLSYVTDSTNLQTDYLRNKIRMEIIPKFYEINPSVDKAFLRMQKTLFAEENFLDKEATDIFEKMKKDNFSLKYLKEKDDIFYSRVAVKLLEEYNLEIDYNNVERLTLLLKKKNSREQISNDFYFKVQNGRVFFEEEKEFPYFEKIVSKDDKFFSIENSGNFKMIVTEDKDFKKVYKNLLIFALDYDTITGKLVFRQRKEGDKVKLFKRNGTKSLKKAFNEKKISLSDRQKSIVLCDENEIIAVENIGVSEKCAVTEKTERVLLVVKNDN